MAGLLLVTICFSLAFNYNLPSPFKHLLIFWLDLLISFTVSSSSLYTYISSSVFVFQLLEAISIMWFNLVKGLPACVMCLALSKREFQSSVQLVHSLKLNRSEHLHLDMFGLACENAFVVVLMRKVHITFVLASL